MLSESHIEVSKPRRFTARAICVLNCHGLLALIPVVVLVPLAIFVSVKTGSFAAFLLIVLLTAFLPIFFFPLILGNAYVTRLVESNSAAAGGNGFVVQMTLSPRMHSGFRALVEDADDIGRLSITDSELIYEGDAVKLRLPLDSAMRVESRNIGWRGMWICSPRTCVVTSKLPGVTAVEFCERSSLTVPNSRKVARALKQELLAKIEQASK